MNRRTRHLALAMSIALGTVSAGVHADITIDPGPGNGVVIPNIDTQPAFDTPVCYDESGQTGELGNCSTPPTGAVGSCAFASFYALMPPDNAITVAVGDDVEFPQDGPNSGLIVRSSADQFLLPAIAVYQVMFQVSVDEAGQLVLELNGVELPYTVVGRATGTSQLVGMALVQTTEANSVLSVSNPTGNPSALTITPLAGGAQPVSAHLVITQLPGPEGCTSGATGPTGPTGATGPTGS